MEVKLLRYTENGVELVAKSARVSGVPDTLTDKEIIRMIVENDYTSALEHITFTFDVSGISIALSRELLEHRIASHTARSTRYNIEKDFKFVIPSIIKNDSKITPIYKDAMRKAREMYSKIYDEMIKSGYSKSEAREVARYVLPMAAHTHYVWTINARSLINFLGLRLCKRAAPEIRELAQKIYNIVVKIYPEIFENVGCRGYTIGICPENEARPKDCPFINKIPAKKEIKNKWKEKLPYFKAKN